METNRGESPKLEDAWTGMARWQPWSIMPPTLNTGSDVAIRKEQPCEKHWGIPWHALDAEADVTVSVLDFKTPQDYVLFGARNEDICV